MVKMEATKNQPASAKSTESPPPPPKRYITTHDAAGTAVFCNTVQAVLPAYEVQGMGYFEAYKTFETPIKLNQEADLSALHSHAHEDSTLTFPRPGEVIYRICDWAPGAGTPFHRHESVDFATVIQGEVEAIMESGETRAMRAGDCLVQRATLHAWRNPSTTEFARVLFVINGCAPVTVGDKVMSMNLGEFGK